MDDEIQLINDGDGLAVVGSPTMVERFLTSVGLPARDLGLDRIRPPLGLAAGAAQAGSVLAANSGRWMKLTEESARIASQAPFVINSKTGCLHATVRAQNGRFLKNLEFVKGPQAGLLAGPAAPAAAAALMAQLAMEQAMEVPPARSVA